MTKPKVKRGAPAPKFPCGFVIGVLMVGLGLLTLNATLNHEKVARLQSVVNALPKSSTHGCATWKNGDWEISGETTSYIGFDVLMQTVPGCSQSINIFKVYVGSELSEEAMAATLRKISVNMQVWDYSATTGFKFPVTNDNDLVVLIDGLAFLAMPEADQMALGIVYGANTIMWDFQDPDCNQLKAIHEMSIQGQIVRGGVQSLVDKVCEGRGS